MRRALLVALGLLALAGCAQDMYDQTKYKPYEASRLWADGAADRPRVPGTVARGQVPEPAPQNIPFPVTREWLARGHERFDIYCSPCHGLLGNGEGMIVRRGFPHPPSYHTDRLRQAPDKHFYDVMTQGYGAMYSYAARVPPHDRWAIVAYIRALQLSQNVRLQDLPQAERQRLAGVGP